MENKTKLIGKIFWHRFYGLCKVVLIDEKRGMLQVKWPENSSSQAFFSLVKLNELKEQDNGK